MSCGLTGTGHSVNVNILPQVAAILKRIEISEIWFHQNDSYRVLK